VSLTSDLMNASENSECPLCPRNDLYLYKMLSDEFTLEYLDFVRCPNEPKRGRFLSARRISMVF
jgi:hypothetical protein